MPLGRARTLSAVVALCMWRTSTALTFLGMKAAVHPASTLLTPQLSEGRGFCCPGAERCQEEASTYLVMLIFPSISATPTTFLSVTFEVETSSVVVMRELVFRFLLHQLHLKVVVFTPCCMQGGCDRTKCVT